MFASINICGRESAIQQSIHSMDFSVYHYSSAILALLLFLCHLQWKRRTSTKHRAAPIPHGAWPLLGHLPMLLGPQTLHITLGSLADKYGPVFAIKFGIHESLVVSSWEVAKECFTTNDRVFATRPKSVIVKTIGYNYAFFAFAPYGPYWREARKIAILQLLSNHRIELLKHVRISEVSKSIKEIYQLWGDSFSDNRRYVAVEMKEWSAKLSLNMIARMVARKRFSGGVGKLDDEGRRLLRAIHDFFHLTGVFLVSDAFPSLGWFDVLRHKKIMQRTAKEFDSIMSKWLEEHKQKNLKGGADIEHRDFMDVLLSTLEDKNLYGFEANVVNKAISLNVIMAATDTTSITLIWALSLLLNNQEVLHKAQDEIEAKVGKGRQIEEADIEKLVYLQAIVKETLRLYPAAPLSVQHVAMADCTVAGYHVPAGTRLITNLWKIQQDPRIWSNPSEFHPERFLPDQAKIDLLGTRFELIPFGSGRRSCPGAALALQVVQLTLARLLQGFNFKTRSDAAVDMTLSAGLTTEKALPLEVLISPRLPENLY